MATVHDPVCGMDIEQSAAAGSTRYEGQTYWFCSTACQRTFEENPSRYAGATQGTGAHAQPLERHTPPRTTTDGITAPMFGAAGSGGLEYEPIPEEHDRDRTKDRGKDRGKD